MPASRVGRLFFAVFLLSRSVSGAEDFIGSVKTARGGVVRRATETIPVSEGMHLQLNDTLQTSADGVVGIILQDGTRISLGPNSELKLDRFVYQPADGKFGLLLRLGHGALSYISGKIAHFAPESVSVETPVGVLGLRGTHFAVSLEGN